MEHKKKKLFFDKIFYEKLLRFALPIAFQNLMLASVAAADALMLGNMDQNSMSAVSMATQVQFIQNMVLSGASGTIGILGAQYWGKKDRKSIDDVFAIGLRLSGFVSFLTFIGCFFFPGFLMTILTDEPALQEIGIRYLRIAGWSYLLTGISQCYQAVMKISDRAAMTAKISTTAVLVNIGLNAVFIFGLFGFPAMGVQGAALATLVSRVIELLWCVFISFGKGYIQIPVKRLFRHNRVLSGDFIRCCLPLMGAALSWGVGFASYTAFMGHMGTDAAAANSVSAVVRDLVCCLCNGLGAAAGIIVGNELGAGDLAQGKLYGSRCMKLSYVCGILSTAIMLLVTPVLMKLVKLSPEAHRFLLQMMLIMSFYMIGRTVNTVIINGIFAAGGDTKFDFYSLAVAMWGMAIPLAALGTFAFHWPVAVVYACTCLDEVGKIPWVMAHYRKYKWVKDLTREYTN